MNGSPNFSRGAMADPLAAFLDAMEAAGVVPRDRLALASKLAANPGLVRFRCDGERNTNGWATLHLDAQPAGRFGNWRLGIVASWRADRAQKLCAADRAEFARVRRAWEAETRRGHEATAASCLALWQAARPASAAHCYLAAKRMNPAGLRAHGAAVLIPMHDAAGRLWSLQSIFPDGSKRFARGGRCDGMIWQRGEPGETIAIGEGVATMAAVHAATGLSVAAAFTAGNLAAAARAVRKQWPAARLILCADDDAGRSPNVGMDAANAAARTVGGLVARPPKPPGWPEGKGWDFADTWNAPHGAEAIRRAFALDNGDAA